MADENTSGDHFLLFDKYDSVNIEINDPALRPYINLQPKLVVKAYGRNTGKFSKTKVNILERIANRLATSGHIGKKHKIITGWSFGNCC